MKLYAHWICTKDPSVSARTYPSPQSTRAIPPASTVPSSCRPVNIVKAFWKLGHEGTGNTEGKSINDEGDFQSITYEWSCRMGSPLRCIGKLYSSIRISSFASSNCIDLVLRQRWRGSKRKNMVSKYAKHQNQNQGTICRLQLDSYMR